MLVSYARKKLEKREQLVSWDKFLVTSVGEQVCGMKFKGKILVIGGHRQFEEFMLMILFDYLGVTKIEKRGVSRLRSCKIMIEVEIDYLQFVSGRTRMKQDGLIVERKKALGSIFY